MPEESVQLLVGGVSYPTPASGVIARPQPAKANGQPLLEQRVRLLELGQAQGDHVVLQGDLLTFGVVVDDD